jgi:endonuclease-3
MTVPQRSEDERKEQARGVVRGLAKAYPEATCALTHESPYELLVATILSAQCTDERVNMVTPKLFARFPAVSDLAAASQHEVEGLVRSTGFFRAKASSLRGMAQAVVENHGCEIPRTLEELVKLPGVGRKTANVLLGTAFGMPSGIVVDTHVRRITNLLGLTRQKDPEKIERELMQIVPKKDWIDFSHRLIHHGREFVSLGVGCTECISRSARVRRRPHPQKERTIKRSNEEAGGSPPKKANGDFSEDYPRGTRPDRSLSAARCISPCDGVRCWRRRTLSRSTTHGTAPRNDDSDRKRNQGAARKEHRHRPVR